LLRVSWYFVRVILRHRRCSGSGTKLKTSSSEIRRFTRRSASRKSFFRPRRPRLDKACARCNVPDIRAAPSRFRLTGRQCCSSAAQTGVQYRAVDSITTSSTCCSIIHCAISFNCSGLAPYQRRSNWYPSSISTSVTTTASFFLWTSIPAILYGIGFLLAGAESVPGITLSRISGYRRSHRGSDNATIYSLYQARSGSDRRTVLVSPLITQPRRFPPSWIIAWL